MNNSYFFVAVLLLSISISVLATDEAGTKFLEENAKLDDILITSTGIQYRILESGDSSGPSPSKDDKVKVHYKGTLVDDTPFDSSYDRGIPAEFPVRGVIAGWTEILQLMKIGDKWETFIPSELAYGSRGIGQVIPPNSLLKFQIELIDIPSIHKEEL